MLEINRFAKFDKTKMWYNEITKIRKNLQTYEGGILMIFTQFCDTFRCVVRLLVKPGPGTWIRTLKNLNPKKHRSWKTWTQKKLDPKNHELRKILTIKNLVNSYIQKKIRRAHSMILLKSGSHLPEKLFLFASKMPLKMFFISC